MNDDLYTADEWISMLYDAFIPFAWDCVCDEESCERVRQDQVTQVRYFLMQDVFKFIGRMDQQRQNSRRRIINEL